MQTRPISIPKRLSPEKEVPKPDSKPVKMGLEGGGCPFGTGGLNSMKIAPT